MAAKNFRKLFEPYTVKSMTLRNRIVMTPIGTNFAEHTGEVNERSQLKLRVFIHHREQADHTSFVSTTITIFLDYTDYVKASMTADPKSASY